MHATKDRGTKSAKSAKSVAAKEDSHGQTAVATQDLVLVLSVSSNDRRLPEVGETTTGQAQRASDVLNKGR
jgi:hypothetical protein